MLVEVFSDDVLIGTCNLDRLDPPMGVAVGDLAITKSYDKNLHAYLIDEDSSKNRGGSLRLQSAENDRINYGEISIHDVSTSLGEIELTVFGIPYPEFETYFSEHPHHRSYFRLDLPEDERLAQDKDIAARFRARDIRAWLWFIGVLIGIILLLVWIF